MSDSTVTPRSKAKTSAPSSDEFEIVELKPPADSGFSGTALLRAVEDAALIAELLKRGYVTVTRR
jgi:hypothetical protein